MSHTDHARPRRAWGATAPQHADRAPRTNPRPPLRRQRTRLAAVLRAIREEQSR